MKNIENGIYIPDANRKLHTIEEWAKQSDPKTAQTVVLVTDICSIEIAKEDLPGTYDFDDAQKAAAAYGQGFRCPTRHEGIEMYDARFRGLDDAFRLVGGEPANSGYRWTRDSDPEPTYTKTRGYLVDMDYGDVVSDNKTSSTSVRAVSAFQI